MFRHGVSPQTAPFDLSAAGNCHRLLIGSFQDGQHLPGRVQMMHHHAHSITCRPVQLLSIPCQRQPVICHQLVELVLDVQQQAVKLVSGSSLNVLVPLRSRVQAAVHSTPAGPDHLANVRRLPEAALGIGIQKRLPSIPALHCPAQHSGGQPLVPAYMGKNPEIVNADTGSVPPENGLIPRN